MAYICIQVYLIHDSGGGIGPMRVESLNKNKERKKLYKFVSYTETTKPIASNSTFEYHLIKYSNICDLTDNTWKMIAKFLKISIDLHMHSQTYFIA